MKLGSMMVAGTGNQRRVADGGKAGGLRGCGCCIANRHNAKIALSDLLLVALMGVENVS
jgi:hypothetical protein